MITKDVLNKIIMHANDVAGTAATESEGAVDGNEAFLDVMYNCLIKEIYDIKVKPAIDPFTQRIDSLEATVKELAEALVETNRKLAETDNSLDGVIRICEGVIAHLENK